MNINFKYNLITFVIVSASLLTLSSCNNDVIEPDTGNKQESANINMNSNIKGNEMLRIEVPRLAEGRKLVLVKSTAQYGINYITEWDCDKKSQRWSCWEWNNSNSVKNWNRSNWNGSTWMGITWTGDPFQADQEIPSQYRTELSDYKFSGYDRGHICASEDRICNQDVNGQTFFLSNMQPQINSFNAQVWANLESQVRKWNNSSFRDTMWICKGGTIGNVFLNGKEVSGVLPNTTLNMPVPKYFYMAIVSKKNGEYKGIAFWLEHKPNNDNSFAKYAMSIDELEKITGIDFFCNLPDNIENSVESKSSFSTLSWGLQ